MARKTNMPMFTFLSFPLTVLSLIHYLPNILGPRTGDARLGLAIVEGIICEEIWEGAREHGKSADQHVALTAV